MCGAVALLSMPTRPSERWCSDIRHVTSFSPFAEGFEKCPEGYDDHYGGDEAEEAEKHLKNVIHGERRLLYKLVSFRSAGVVM